MTRDCMAFVGTVLLLAGVAGYVWAATFRRRQAETGELLDLELELEEAWPQGDDLEFDDAEEPAGTGSAR